MNTRTLFVLGLFGATLACASLDSAASSGSNMAKKNLGHTDTATKSAVVDEEKEAADMEKAAEAGMENAEETTEAETETGADSGE
ncbi:MAG: hypothetical protein RIT81_06275 [Deltaproteobacteria bacterium]